MINISNKNKFAPSPSVKLFVPFSHISATPFIIAFDSLGQDACVKSPLMEANNLWNHLATIGESISNKQLVNIVLNGLPCSYDMIT